MRPTPLLRNRPGLTGLFAGVGTAIGGVLGGVAGLVVGLVVHPPTAWFAVLELGIPAAVAGGVVGVVAGLGIRALALGRGTRGEAPGPSV